MEKEGADRVKAWGGEYLSAAGERSIHPRNPFLSRSHNLGVLLKCLCLRDPSVMVPHSGVPSVREEAFHVRVPLGSLSVSWPLCRVQQQGPCLESHPASKGQEVVCLQSLFVWGPGSPPACSSQESSRGLANAQPWSRLALSDRPSLRWSFPASLPAGPVLSPGSCRPPAPVSLRQGSWLGLADSRHPAPRKGSVPTHTAPGDRLEERDMPTHPPFSASGHRTPTSLPRGLRSDLPKLLPESQSELAPGAGPGSPGRKGAPRVPPRITGTRLTTGSHRDGVQHEVAAGLRFISAGQGGEGPSQARRFQVSWLIVERGDAQSRLAPPSRPAPSAQRPETRLEPQPLSPAHMCPHLVGRWGWGSAWSCRARFHSARAESPIPPNMGSLCPTKPQHLIRSVYDGGGGGACRRCLQID